MIFCSTDFRYEKRKQVLSLFFSFFPFSLSFKILGQSKGKTAFATHALLIPHHFLGSKTMGAKNRIFHTSASGSSDLIARPHGRKLIGNLRLQLIGKVSENEI